MITISTKPLAIPSSFEEEEEYLTQELEETLASFLIARKTFHKRCYKDLLTMQQICADLEKYYMD